MHLCAQNQGLSITSDLCYSFISAAAVASLLWKRWEVIPRFPPLPQSPVTYHCNTYRRKKGTKTSLYKSPPSMYNIAKRGSGQVAVVQPLQASRGRCKAARGPCVRSPGSGTVKDAVAASGGPPLQGHRAAQSMAAQGGWYRGRSGLSPRIGAEDLLFSINSWRRVCTTRYRRI
jgi:hypothetical protein